MSNNRITKQLLVVPQEKVNPNLLIEDVTFINASGQAATPLFFVTATVSTQGSISTKTVSIKEPVPNTLVVLTFTNGNSVASPSISFAGGSARSIYIGGDLAVLNDINLAANSVILCWFDGTKLHLTGMQ